MSLSNMFLHFLLLLWSFGDLTKGRAIPSEVLETRALDQGSFEAHIDGRTFVNKGLVGFVSAKDAQSSWLAKS